MLLGSAENERSISKYLFLTHCKVQIKFKLTKFPRAYYKLFRFLKDNFCWIFIFKGITDRNLILSPESQGICHRNINLFNEIPACILGFTFRVKTWD